MLAPRGHLMDTLMLAQNSTASRRDPAKPAISYWSQIQRPLGVYGAG